MYSIHYFLKLSLWKELEKRVPGIFYGKIIFTYIRADAISSDSEMVKTKLASFYESLPKGGRAKPSITSESLREKHVQSQNGTPLKITMIYYYENCHQC